MRPLPSKSLIFLLLLFVATGTAPVTVATAQPNPIAYNLAGILYSSDTQKSESYPIFVKIYKTDQVHLVYRGQSGSDSILIFVRKTAGDAVGAIEKFLEWERLATSRKETLSKKIASVGSVSGAYVYFGFRSIEAERHVLVMGIRSKLLGDSSGAASGIVDAMMDRENAGKLRNLLVRFSKGESLKDPSDVYR